MDFKHNIMPGHWTRHSIVRSTERIKKTSNKQSVTETLHYEQKAEWTQCNIDDPDPGSAVLYQMMVDEPARVVDLFRGKEKISSLPKPDELNLSKGSTRLVSAKRKLRSSPGQTPLVEQPEKSILQMLLDSMRTLQPGSIAAGHKWSEEISTDSFDGKREFEFVDLVKEKGETAARITLYVTGKFKGLLARKYEFEKMQAIIYWSRMDQGLQGIEAQAAYHVASGKTSYKMKINVGLQQSGRVDEKQQEDVKSQISAINDALKEVQAGHGRDALKIAGAFKQEWPRSMWMPAIKEIEKQVGVQSQPVKRFSDEELLDVLTRVFVKCEAALANEDEDQSDAARRLLAGLNITRSQLKRMLKSKQETVRAMAVFGMALSDRADAKREIYAAYDDESEKVRAVVLIALALRGDGDTSADLLRSAMDDKSAGVRARACDAISACILRENTAVDVLVEKLDKLMVHDKSDIVRRSAIRAIAAIGGPPDIAKLHKALTHELSKANRAEIERAIAHLQTSGG